MTKLFAVARRVLTQLRHDPRTLVVMFVAPCLALWLFSILLGVGEYRPQIAAHDLPEELQISLEKQEISFVKTTANEAKSMLQNGDIDAVLSYKDAILTVLVEGSDASKTSATLKQIQAAVIEVQQDTKDQIEQELEGISFEFSDKFLATLPPESLQQLENAMVLTVPDLDELIVVQEIETRYLYGDESWTVFDFFSPVFIGIFIFMFVFITCSMSLLTERSGGTITRLVATPVKGWQIVGGYALSFGLIAIMQSAVILFVCIVMIGFPNEGSIVLVGLITVSMAFVSVTLGLLVSGLARTPYQVIQLIIVFVIPQILLSGIFELSQTPEWMQFLAQLLPIYHGAEALRDVMLRGNGISEVATNLTVLWAFIAIFFAGATVGFKKKRAKA